MSDPNAAAVSAAARVVVGAEHPATLAPNPIRPNAEPIAVLAKGDNDIAEPADVVSVLVAENPEVGAAIAQSDAAAAPDPGATPADPTPTRPTHVHPHPHLNTSSSAQPIRPRQRLIICCDGTWQSRDTIQSIVQNNVFTAKEEKWLTNVAIMASAISHDAGAPDENGIIIRQNVLYISGVGTTLSTMQNFYEGVTGASLADKVEEGYSWLADNYSEGDEIFLIGFSRGAYTARCIGAFINWAGLLRKHELIWFRTIWESYQQRKPDDPKSIEAAAETLRKYTGRYPTRDAQETSSDAIKEGVEVEKTPTSAVERVKEKVSWAKAPPIKALCVWDTVGSLGIPGNYMTPAIQNLFSFFDPGLGANVENAFHALALAEERNDFSPTLFFQDPREIRDTWPRQVLRQMWFPGEHSDVGGGWIEHGSSDVTLAWMIGQLSDTYDKPLLNIDLDAVRTLQDRRHEWAKQPDHVSRSSYMQKGVRQLCHKYVDEEERTTWANDCRVGFRHERLHHSVVASGKYDLEKTEMFSELRGRDRALLEKLWAKAADPESMTKTEKALMWTATEKDQVLPLAGAGHASARGHAGNGLELGPIAALFQTAAHKGQDDDKPLLPVPEPVAQSKHHTHTAEEPTTLKERIKLGADVVETGLSDAFKTAVSLPSSILDHLKGRKEGEGEEK